jgi:beta-lactamase class A
MKKNRFFQLLLFCPVLILIAQCQLFFGADIEGLKKAVETEIRASGAEVSVAFRDLESSQDLFIREKEMVHAASTMKVPVMIEVFKQAEDGKFSLDDRLVIKNEFRSLVDGSPFSLRPEDDSETELYTMIGQDMSIRELVERMITVSSNLATNLMIELVEAKNVMATLEQMGVRRMRVLRGVEDTKAYEKGLNNQTDAYDLMLVMEAIATGKAGPEPACREMIEILKRQKHRAAIPAGLPQGVSAGNKPGWIQGIVHDAAIIFPPGRKPYVLVVLTSGLETEEEGQKLIARLSKLVYEEVMDRQA